MVQDSRSWIMANAIGTSKNQKKIISTLEGMERAFLSIILMNKGKIPGTKLKRIYLEKHSFWEMQRTEKKLIGKGLLEKKGGTGGGETIEYEVPEKHIDILSKSFSPKTSYSTNKEQPEQISMAPCGEYSILWYLWQIDSIIDYNLLSSKPLVRIHGASLKKAEELLGVEREDIRFLIEILKGLSTTKFITKNNYKKWSAMINSSHKVTREIFKIALDAFRESNELGRDDLGKDNLDFFLEELAGLKFGQWYSLEAFVSNARSTLFKCYQPFRWIHFDEDSVWNIINHKLKMLGVVETALNKDKEKFFMPTILGGQFLGKISEKKLVNILSSRKGKFMVHPNFEVTVVSKELNPKTLLELAMFSHPIILDTMSVFRISRESVNEGLRLGLTTEEMTSFLKENSKGEIPQNVEYSILDWGK